MQITCMLIIQITRSGRHRPATNFIQHNLRPPSSRYKKFIADNHLNFRVLCIEENPQLTLSNYLSIYCSIRLRLMLSVHNSFFFSPKFCRSITYKYNSSIIQRSTQVTSIVQRRFELEFWDSVELEQAQHHSDQSLMKLYQTKHQQAKTHTEGGLVFQNKTCKPETFQLCF